MKQKIPYVEAAAHASLLLEALETACDRSMIAGSIRRQKPEIGDSELVLIPQLTPTRDLFGEPSGTYESALDQRLTELTIKLTKNGEKHKQGIWQGMQAALFICMSATWAMNITIRTGNADFTRWPVTP